MSCHLVCAKPLSKQVLIFVKLHIRTLWNNSSAPWNLISFAKMYFKSRSFGYCLMWCWNRNTLLGRPQHGIDDEVIKWKHFPRYWSFVRGIHRWPVNSPHKGQWRGALMFSLICAWINRWVKNREAGDLRRHRAHYDVIVMLTRHDQRPLIFF